MLSVRKDEWKIDVGHNKLCPYGKNEQKFNVGTQFIVSNEQIRRDNYGERY